MNTVEYAVRGADGTVVKDVSDQGNPTSINTISGQQVYLMPQR